MPFFPRSRSNSDDRRRGEDGDAGRAASFEVESLEFVQASDELGLMRLAGRWYAPVDAALQDIMLVVTRGTETLSLAPLPDLKGVAPVASPAGEPWRGAFKMPVEAAEDRRAELMLRAGDEVRVQLPRVDEWARMQAEAEAAAAEEAEHGDAEQAEPAGSAGEPTLLDTLMARLQEVARMDEEPAVEEARQPDVEPAPLLDAQPEPTAATADPQPQVDPAHSELRTELARLRAEVQQARDELQAERQRRQALDEEIRMRLAVEDDLRSAIAMREAELAAAAAEAMQRARRDERRRDLTTEPAAREHPEHPRSRPADEEFLTRLELARSLSQTTPQ